MATDRELLEKATDWLYKHKDIINLTEIGKRIDLDKPDMLKAVSRLTNAKGTVVKIPERCLPALKEVLAELRKAPKL